MSQTIEHREVEFDFNNENFEKNINTSISSLDRLKSSLNMDGAAAGFAELEKVSNSLKFDGMAKNLDFLAKRFSTFGIVGMRVISNLTDATMNFVHKTTSTVTDAIVGGGKRRATNIENARFQLQGLLNDEEKVEAIMADALKSVNGTAYAFDEAAKAASQFAATGMQAGKDMYGALRAITGVAAMTNSEYEGISRIFTTVAGNGRLMGDQLLQLSSRGLNAASTLTSFFNGVNDGSIEVNDNIEAAIHKLTKGLKMTEGDIREFVSGGKISFDIFAKAMDNAFGDHAKKANDTLTGAIANTRAALARTGEKFITPLIVQKGPLVQFFNSLREQINNINGSIQPLADTFTDAVRTIVNMGTRLVKEFDLKPFLDNVVNLTNRFHDFLSTNLFDRFWEFSRLLDKSGISIDDFGRKAWEVAQKSGVPFTKLFKTYDDLIAHYGSLQQALKGGWLTTDVFKKVINTFTGDTEPFTSSMEKATAVLEKFGDVADSVIRGNFGNGAERVKKLTEAGYDYALIQSIVNHKLLGWEIAIDRISDAELKNLGLTKEQVKTLRKLQKEAEKSGVSLEEMVESFSQPTGAELLLGSISNVFKAVKQYAGIIGKAWTNIFDLPTVSVKKALLSINNLTSKLVLTEKGASNLQKTLEGIFAGIDLIKNGIVSIFKFGGRLLTMFIPALGKADVNLLSITGKIGEAITKFHDWVKVNDVFQSISDKILNAVGFAISEVVKMASTFADSLQQNQIFNSILDKVKDFFQNIDEYAKTGLDKAKELFENVKNFVKDIDLTKITGQFKTFIETLKSATLLTNISSAFNNFAYALRGGLNVDNLRKAFSGLFEDLSKAISFEGLSKTIDTVKEKILELFRSIIKKSGTAKSSMNGLVETFRGQLESFGIDVDKLEERLDKFVEFMKKHFSNFSIGSVFTMLFGVGTLKIMNNFAKLLAHFKTPILSVAEFLDTCKEIPRSIAGVFSGLKKGIELVSFSMTKVLDAYRHNIHANNLLKIALAIGVLAGSLYLIAMIPADRLWESVGAITVLAGLLMTLEAVSASLATAVGSFKSIGLAIAMFSGSLVAIAIAFKIMETLDYDQALNSLELLGLIAIGMAGVGYAFGKMGASGIGNAALLLSLAVSVAIIAKALKELEGVDTKGLKKVGPALGQMIVVIGGVVALINVVGGESWQSSAMILAFAVSLKIIVSAMKDISKMEPDQIAKGLQGVQRLLKSFIPLIAVSVLAGENAREAGLMLLGLSVALKIMVGVIKSMAKIKPADLNKAMQVIRKMLLVFALVIAASRLSGEHAAKAGAMLFGMAAALVLMTAAIVIMALIPEKALDKAISAIQKLLLSFSLLIASTHFAGGEIKQIIALAFAIAVLVAALGFLSMIDEQSLAGAANAMSMVTAAAAALAFGVSRIKVETIAKTMTAMLMFTALIAAIAAAIGLLAHFTNPDAALASAAGISLVLIAFSISLRQLDTMLGFSKRAMVSIGFMLLIVAGLAAVIGVLAHFTDDADKTLKVATALSLTVLAFSVACAILSKSSVTFQSGLASVAFLLELMAGVTLFVMACAALNEKMNGGLEDLLTKGLPLLQLIGKNIGEFIGGILSGALDALGLSDIALQLTSFIEQIKAFFDYAGSIDQGAIDAIPKIAGAILALSAAEFLDGIGSLFGKLTGYGDIKSFGEKMKDFASALVEFGQTVQAGDFDSSQVEAATTLARTISELEHNLPKSGGVLQKFLGETDLDLFSTNLPKLASGLHQFLLIIGNDNFDASSAQSAANIAETLSTLNNNLPKTGGILNDWVLGNVDLDKFSANLPKLASGLHQFILIVGRDEINKEAIDSAVNVAELLTVLAKDIPNDGGILGFVMGNNDLGSFASNIETLGNGLNSFSHSMDDVNVEASDKVQRMMSALTGAAAMQKANAGMLNSLSSETTTLAASLQGLGIRIESVNPEKMEQIVRAITSLIQGCQNIASVDVGKIDTVVQAVAHLGEIDFTDIGPKIETAANSMSNMASKMVQAFNTGISNANGIVGKNAQVIANSFVSAVMTKIPVASSAGTKLGEALGSGINNTSKTIPTQVSIVLITTIAKVSSYQKNFNAVGSNLAKALASGLGSVGLSSAITGKLSSAVSSAREYHGSFYRAGAYLAEGLRDGIRDKASAVASAAASMVISALTAARRAANEHSPSKETYEIGDYFGQGFINAIVDHFRNARKAGAGMVEQALKGTERPVKMINDIIQNGIDAQPTITPVLDLSQIKAGTGQINGILGATPALAMAGNISYSFNRNRTEATNDDVVHAINKLNKAIAEMPRESTTINGVTYDDGSNINDAVRQLVRAARIERRA